MGDDIAALIGHLGLGQPDVVGYSLGGGVAFFTAVRHPEAVRRLVMVSTGIRRNAIYAGHVRPSSSRSHRRRRSS